MKQCAVSLTAKGHAELVEAVQRSAWEWALPHHAADLRWLASGRIAVGQYPIARTADALFYDSYRLLDGAHVSRDIALLEFGTAMS
jgi:hypothetical protein